MPDQQQGKLIILSSALGYKNKSFTENYCLIFRHFGSIKFAMTESNVMMDRTKTRRIVLGPGDMVNLKVKHTTMYLYIGLISFDLIISCATGNVYKRHDGHTELRK
jgi:hypothetical protein